MDLSFFWPELRESLVESVRFWLPRFPVMSLESQLSLSPFLTMRLLTPKIPVVC